LFGLVLQLVACGAALGLAVSSGSRSLFQFAWFLAGGIPIWFTALLIFQQRALAALERMDLEELRREKAATGGGQALFEGEGGEALRYHVAETRLQWMQRWLLPALGLLTALYLIGAGVFRWTVLPSGLASEQWGALQSIPLTMIALTIIMLLLFLFSRFTSGMGRVAEWNLLRACGSYMLGSALGALALIIALGVHLYAGTSAWERGLAYAFPVLMVLLGAEMLLNFVLDIYRPRAPGTESRAAFDSRLLGLIAEPGGIASTIAEAMNYQFGFQVSQTWFYQLLQRACVPLAAVGLLALWLLTAIVVVQPHERCIVETFGRQVNAENPLGSGLHWKWPWPISMARKYNTEQLHQIVIGFRQYDAEPVLEGGPDAGDVVQWVDRQHMGRDHFDFIVPPSRLSPPGMGTDQEPAEEPALGGPQERTGERVPVDMIRMDVVVQYRVRAADLPKYTQQTEAPERILRNVAWAEVARFTATCTVDALLGERRASGAQVLRKRIEQQVAARGLGLDIVWVGIENAHPETSVAKAFRNVVKAEQESIGEVRKALVQENETLARVAGDKSRALGLAAALDEVHQANVRLNETDQMLRGADPAAQNALAANLAELEPLFAARTEARWRWKQADEWRARLEQDFRVGLGRTAAERRRADELVHEALAAELAAAEALEQALQPLRAESEGRMSPAQIAALIDSTSARFALEFWNQRLEGGLRRLEGEAAVKLSQAQARRWRQENDAAGQLAQLQNEIEAYRAAPEIFLTRAYLEALVEGLEKSRKYFLAFDPGDREVRVRILAQEQARPDISEMSTQAEN